MSDIRREETQVSALDIGMYVCELDRPWLGTPFMFEGLLIEDQSQIDTLVGLCSVVSIDRTLSVGSYFTAPPKETAAIKREANPIHINTSGSFVASKQSPKKSNTPTNSNEKISFFNILKEIKESNQAANNNSTSKNTGNGTIFKIQPVNQPKKLSETSLLKQQDTAQNSPTLGKQIKSDLSSLVSGLKNWRPNKHKGLSTEIDKDALKEELANQAEQVSSDSLYIYDDRPLVEEEIINVYPVFEKTQIATRELFEALANDQKIDLTNVNEILTGLVESIERNPDALIWLSKLKKTDDYAYNHALNVSITLMALATFMSLPKAQVKDLGLAGLLQDIGKGKISSELLHKTEQISDEEYALLKKHVDYALELLEVTDKISSTVILTVSQHHERLDGTGYPFRLSGKKISMTGQMAGLVDTYCALTTNKVYAKGVYNQIALEEIHGLRDIKFSGVLIDQLVQFLGIYPVGTLVELNSGEVGVVIQQNNVRRLQPRVMVLLNPDKTRNESPVTLDLIHSPKTASGEPYKIVKGLPPDSYDLDSSNFYG